MRSPKPTVLALKTTKVASLPSELPRSAHPGTPLVLKLEDDTKTPITPPTAYTDFLKAVSSPSSSSLLLGSGKSTPTSLPSSAHSSQTSHSSCSCDPPATAKSAVPPSPYTFPQSAPMSAPPRRLRIPPSPMYSPAALESPGSAHSIRSPFNLRSPFEWDLDGKRWTFDWPKPGTGRPVSVRQVITRTVTYTPCMDLKPAPKGKKRRLE